MRPEALQHSLPDVSRETVRRLTIFRTEFERWSERINLTAGVEHALDERHIMDSLQLLAIRPPVSRWVDVGTGGGFPGAILAAAEADHDATITMIESNNKKAAFLRAVSLAMGSNARVLAERAEVVVAREDAPDTVSARALAPLPKLLALLEPWLENGTVGVFPKGRMAVEELKAAERDWRFECELHPSQTAADATIVTVRNLSRRSVKQANG